MGSIQIDEVPLDPIPRGVVGEGGFEAFNPRTDLLKKGWKHPAHDNARPLPCDLFVEHDVAIPMRDGAILYADVYRPPGSEQGEKVPALLCWSPFGKKFNGILSLKYMTPWNLGVKPGTLSGLEKFEAPNPADWCPRGYAIVNIDSRGSGESDGRLVIMGSQEARDGYDAIEHIAKLPWCSGDIGLAGNSHLAIIQWFIAALQPPSLKAIAPWEGCGDLYREQFARGDIYSGDLFDKLIVKHMFKGKQGVESFRQMFEKHPLANDWWNDKRPDMTKIKVPTYITSTWTNTMHGVGAIRAWIQADTTEKWLRWHPWQERYDLWGNPQAKDELFQFFDYYLHGKKDNGWNEIPRVRMALLRFGKKEPQSYENSVEKDFPPKRTQYRELYFCKDGKLAEQAAQEEAKVSYEAEQQTGHVSFTHTFAETTRIMGLPKAVVYMSCPDKDDMDVYVTLEKLDRDGKQMMNLNVPWKSLPVQSFDEMKPQEMTEVVIYKGPMGVLRASLRSIDESKSMHPHWPFHPHDREDKVTPGTIARLDIGIWAFGVKYDAGESIRVVISGKNRTVSNFGSDEHVRNKGSHNVHVGGEHASHVILPFV